MAQRLVLAFLVTAPLVAYARAEPPRKEDAARKAEPVKKPKPDVKQVVQALVKAYEDNKSKDLAPLCSKEFLKHLPPAQFESFFRSFKVKYGNLNGEATAVKDSRLVYVVPAEKQAFFLKITLDGDGLLAGLQLVPAMLENLPAGPLTLADVQERSGAMTQERASCERAARPEDEPRGPVLDGEEDGGGPPCRQTRGEIGA